MITKEDLELLERIYSPLARILLEHLRVDHEYNFIPESELLELRSEFTVLKEDYELLYQHHRREHH